MRKKPWERSYDPGVDQIPFYSSIPLKEQFIAWVQRQPDHPYIYHMDQVITYLEANRAACTLANMLLDAGVGKGDRVAITLPNIPEFVFAVQACLKIGAVVVPANPRYTQRELTSQYQNSGVKVIICQRCSLEIHINLVAQSATAIEKIIIVSESPNTNTLDEKQPIELDFINYHELVGDVHAMEPIVNIQITDLALILYTSGTTGNSKGCCITNANLVAVAVGWASMCQYFTDLSRFKVLLSTPLYHIYGFQTAINANILLGGSIVMVSDTSSEGILQAINRYEPNVWPTVPTSIINLSGHPRLPGSKISKLQYIGCGAFPIPVAKMQDFEEATGTKILEGYGASETTMAVSSNPLLKRKLGSVGIPYPGIDCKVVDCSTGLVELPLGEIGELCFRGAQVIKEYWQNPTDTVLNLRESWWYSGDIGYMDNDGFLYIVDRKKDIIIFNGFNIFSKEVDEVLLSHPHIAEAAVVGVPDASSGERVKAFIVVKPGCSLRAEDVQTYCRTLLAAYKVPSEIEFIEKLPRNAVQKIDRKQLRAR